MGGGYPMQRPRWAGPPPASMAAGQILTQAGGQLPGGMMVGAQMVGGQMVGGQMVGGQMVGGQMVGSQMVGGQMVGGQMVGGQMVGGQMSMAQLPGGHMQAAQLQAAQLQGGQMHLPHMGAGGLPAITPMQMRMHAQMQMQGAMGRQAQIFTHMGVIGAAPGAPHPMGAPPPSFAGAHHPQFNGSPW